MFNAFFGVLSFAYGCIAMLFVLSFNPKTAWQIIWRFGVALTPWLLISAWGA